MKPNRQRIKFCIATLVILFASMGVFAQQISKGTITSEKGDPLQGVSVTNKGTKKTVATDSNGFFNIETNPGNILVLSFTGYKTKEIVASANVNIIMEIEAGALSEVVIIGYQTVQKKDLTGAVSVVNVADANKITASTVAESIQGLAAGVSVRNSGAPGGGAKIDIRGTGTFGENNPLYVIDGMLSDATPDFNSNDIESIQILKDASAAAIYGSRAANGVVIITTKKGKEGPLVFTGSLKTGMQEFHKRWDLMNSTEFAQLNKQAYINSGITPPPSVSTEFNPSVNTNWQDIMMRTGYTQEYNVSLSGGGKTASYFVSGDYFKNKGTIIGNSFDKAGLRINTSGERGRFRFGENAYFSFAHTDPYVGNVFLDMLSMLPTMPVQDQRYYSAVENPESWSYGDNANYNTFGTNTYALQKLVQQDSRYYKVRGNTFLEFRLFDWLHYKYNVGLEASFDYNKEAQKPGLVRQGTPYLKPTLNENRSLFLSVLNEHTLNFDKSFGLHKISAVAGISNQTFKSDGLDIQKVGIPSYSGNYYFVPDQSGTPSVSGGINKWAFLGYLGRVNYDYGGRYLVSATIRRDGSSLFGPDYRWGTFPSISGAWKISNESFFHVKSISDLKIRASYGQLGNSEILSPWQYSGNISAYPKYVFGSNQTINFGATNIQLGNPDLRWETKKTLDIGLDIGFLNNRLSISADYYVSKTSDVLVNLPIALTTGNAGGNPPINAASLENSGFEFSATYRENEGQLKWNASANLSTVKNRVTSLGDIGDKLYIGIGDTRTLAGHPIGEWYVLKTAGIFQSQQEVDGYTNKQGKKIQPSAKPGDIKYVDFDGDGKLDFDKDRTFSGSPWPKIQAGLVWDASYRNFTFSMQWYGVFGNKLYNRPLYNLDKLGPNDNQAYRRGIQPWTAGNTNTNIPRLGIVSPGHNDDGLQFNALPQSDRWLESGSYIRLRNLQLGYFLPGSFLSKAGFNSAQIYLSGQNLLTSTKYKGLDPDITGVNIFERGLDNGQYPALRIYSIGLQFKF